MNPELKVKVDPKGYARAWNTANRTATYLAWFAMRGEDIAQRMLFSELLSDHLAMCEQLGFGRPDVSDTEARAREMNAVDRQARRAGIEKEAAA